MIAVLGAFDGFHRGHAGLFNSAGEAAASLGAEWGGVTFEPSPGLYMGTIKKTLFTLRERELIRLYLGIPKLIVLKFDGELSRFSPERFWSYLRGIISVDGIAVGRDFRFGFKRAGDAPLLERYCREEGLFFLSADPLLRDGLKPGGVPLKMSSSIIRMDVAMGRCEAAAGALGYPHFISAKVKHGLERGRKLSFPTANLEVPGKKLIPPEGVYAAAVLVKGEWKAGALSIGTNPTFGDVSDVSAEVFVLDYSGDLYDDNLLVFFLSRLRPQIMFPNPALLVRQIEADAELSENTFKRSMEISPEVYKGFKSANELIKYSGVSEGPAISREPPRYEACESLSFSIRTAQRSSGLCPPEL